MKKLLTFLAIASVMPLSSFAATSICTELDVSTNVNPNDNIYALGVSSVTVSDASGHIVTATGNQAFKSSGTIKIQFPLNLTVKYTNGRTWTQDFNKQNPLLTQFCSAGKPILFEVCNRYGKTLEDGSFCYMNYQDSVNSLNWLVDDNSQNEGMGLVFGVPLFK